MNTTSEENSVIILDSSFDDDLAKAIKSSLEEAANQPTGLLVKQEEQELLCAIESSLKDGHEDEDMLRAIENSLNDLKKQQTSSDTTSSKPSFNAASVYKEQNDMLAAYKQKLVEAGIYQHNDDVNDDELDLILNYISDTHDLGHGEDIIEILQHHYDQLSEQQTVTVNCEVDATLTEASNVVDNRLIQHNWFQRLLQFSTANLRTILDTTADLAVSKVFPILDEYDIIDVRFLRNLLNGKFDAEDTMKFGFDILKKLILLNKLFNEIRLLKLTSLDLTKIVALLRKLGLIKV